MPPFAKSGDQRGQLQRRNLNAFAEAGHARYAAILGRLGGKRAGLFLRKVIAGKLAQSQQARVVRNRVESHAAAELLEESIIGMRQRFHQIQILPRARP